MGEQARAVLKASLSLTSRHEAKAAMGVKGSRSTGRIHSVATFNKYADSLKQAGEWAKEQANVRYIKELTTQLAQHYLAERAAEGIGQKQLDTDRNALEFLVGKGVLEREQALGKSELGARAYTTEQIQAVISHQSERNALATEVAWRTGARAHELLTLRHARDGQASSHRQWDPQRFEGRAGERYIVTGKGGLSREVLIPRALSERLEARRLEQPATLRDRGINYRSHYDIGGGNAWSKSFSDASSRALGWSHGAHGLRHTYAQERMAELQASGIPYYAAREIVSQELGHFRGDIVEVYLR